ncbi:MAG: alpha/beta hydrolase family protein [Acutalibacteraceae bacterium]
MSLATGIYKKIFVSRYDDEGYKYFFTEKDFEGLKKEDFSFSSSNNNLLKGAIYSYDGYDKNTLIVFCHGIGEGHLQYTKEIEALCKNGFRVLTFDITGCAQSEGEDIRGLAQSLADLDSCMKYIAENDYFGCEHIYLIGHSWGGFAVGNLLGRYDNIEKAVIISAFVSVEHILNQYFVGNTNPFIRPIMKYEKEKNPLYAESSMIDALNKTNAKVLVIHSKDDKMVSFKNGAGCLKEKVSNPNIRYIITENKNHHPYYTEEAVTYLNKIFGDFEKANIKGKLKTAEQKKEFMKDVDWNRMTEHDEKIMQEIIGFFKD